MTKQVKLAHQMMDLEVPYFQTNASKVGTWVKSHVSIYVYVCYHYITVRIP